MRLPTTARSAGASFAPRGRTSSARRRLAALAAAVLVGGALVTPGSPRAWSDTVPPEAGLPVTVSSDALPTVQIDGVVWSQAVAQGKVFAGGLWDTARPAGAAAGVSTVAQKNLLAYNLVTGEMDTTFRPVLDGQVLAVAASPDGRTIYVGGDFAFVNGVRRNKLAAFDAVTGQLKPWAPGASASVQSIAVTASSVYVGGLFKAIAVPIGSTGVPRTNAAALDPVSGAVQAFNPVVEGTQTASVRAIAVSPDTSKVMLGGQFETVNGPTSPGGYGLALVDAATGKTSQPLQANQTRVRNAKNNAGILSLTTAPDGVYGTGFAFGNPPSGTIEGAFKADWNGNLVWIEDCHGDSYSVFPTSDVVYVAGHPHYCGNLGGFEQTEPWTFHRALAFTTDARTTLGKEPYAYNNFEGVKAPRWLNWFPDLNTGAKTGQNQGPWHVTGAGDYLVYGGEFTQVNGRGQQGLVRFAKSDIAPDVDGPRLSGAGFTPTVQSFSQGIRLRWPANHDRDNELLTYKLFRSDQANPIYTTQQRSTFWLRPAMSFLDDTAVAGQTYTYRLQATDPLGNIADGNAVSATAAGGASLSAYDQRVLADSPQYYWRLAETTGTAVADTAGGGGTGTRQVGVSTGVPGGIAADPGTAYRFAGDSTSSVHTNTLETPKQVFSVEAWFKTTSTSGGKILSFGSAQTDSSANADRQLYLSPTGQVYFGTNPSGPKTVNSPAGLNNGTWHHVVATQDQSGQKLYVDGALSSSRADTFVAQRYNGYWRIGGDQITGWPGNPTSGYLAGDIDDAAVYDRSLTSAQVGAHYTVGKGTATNVAPLASFTSSANGLTATLNAAGSSDPDGTISSYAWTFGDGSSGTGVSPSKTYAAAATYTVGLTVTDNNGASASTSRAVTVTAPAAGPFASDTFDRTVASGFGTAEVGGGWTTNSTTATSVAGGAGVYRLNAGSGPEAILAATARTSADVTTNVTVDKVATGSGLHLSTIGRRVSTNTDYRATVILASNGTANVAVSTLRGTTTVVNLAAPVTVAGTVAAGTQVHTRLQVSGTSPTTVRAKLWLGAAAEPTAWTVTATDSYAGLQAPGAVGMRTYLSGSATNAPVGVSLLDIAARPVG